MSDSPAHRDRHPAVSKGDIDRGRYLGEYIGDSSERNGIIGDIGRQELLIRSMKLIKTECNHRSKSPSVSYSNHMPDDHYPFA